MKPPFLPSSIAFLLLAKLLPAFITAASEINPVPEGAVVEKVASGFHFTEGPAWDGKRTIYFSDIPRACIHGLDVHTGSVREVVPDSRKSNGLHAHTDGELLVCRHAARDVAVRKADGRIEPLIERFQGDRFNSPNDLDITRDGRIYFTDPRYGKKDDMELDVYGVYVLHHGKVRQLITDRTMPNGIHLSPDETLLYVVDNGAATVWAYDLTPDGGTANGRLFADMSRGEGAGGGDGMAVDRSGRLYVTGRQHVWVFAPSGALITKILVPEGPANCTFGGPDLDTLYITARTSIYRITLHAKGW